MSPNLIFLIPISVIALAVLMAISHGIQHAVTEAWEDIIGDGTPLHVRAVLLVGVALLVPAGVLVKYLEDMAEDAPPTAVQDDLRQQWIEGQRAILERGKPLPTVTHAPGLESLPGVPRS